MGRPPSAQDADGDVVKLVFRNLEQFVAREGVQDMRQRLAVMAGGATGPARAITAAILRRSSGMVRGLRL